METRLELVKKVVLETGQLIRQRINEDMEIETKGGRRSDFVTSVDIEAEKFIVDKISAQFPNDSFLTEEKTVSLQESDYVWIIDPIDGTMNFIYTLRDFAVSIALYVNGVGKIGVVYDVMADELFVGVKGKGVTLNGKPIPKLTPVTLKQSLVDISLKSIRSLRNKGIADLVNLSPAILSHRNLGSAALRITHIGLNRVHMYIASQLCVWDIAAAIIILEELGGVHNFMDKELPYNYDDFVFMGSNNKEIEVEIKEKFFI